MSYDGRKTAFVDTIKGPVPFCVTAVKQYLTGEMTSQGLDPPDSSKIAVVDRIEVYWPMDVKFYSGTISSSHCSSGKHDVTYDDGDVETLDISKERWNFLRNQVAFCHGVQLMRESVRNHHSPSSVNITIVDDLLDN